MLGPVFEIKQISQGPVLTLVMLTLILRKSLDYKLIEARNKSMSFNKFVSLEIT